MEEADKLFKQGLLLYHRAKTDEGFKLVSEIWEQALELYKKFGDKIKIEQLEGYLARLYKSKISKSLNEPLTPNLQSLVSNSESQIAFNEWSMFLKIGCFGFGGPMAVFGLLQEELTERRKILTNKDFLEGAVLGDILPGPVTMDIVTYTGFKLDKWKGAIKSTVLFILPAFIIMLILSMFYDSIAAVPRIAIIFKCLGAAVVGLILMVGIKFGNEEVLDYVSVGIFLWAFISSLIFKFDMVFIILVAGIAGVVIHLAGGGRF